MPVPKKEPRYAHETPSAMAMVKTMRRAQAIQKLAEGVQSL